METQVLLLLHATLVGSRTHSQLSGKRDVGISARTERLKVVRTRHEEINRFESLLNAGAA